MQVHELTVDRAAWRHEAAALAEDGASMLDFLTAIDDPGTGRIEIVAHLVDVTAGRRHLLRTWIERDAPHVESLVSVLPGAAWHEREVRELFGVDFDGNPDLRPLLTDGTADRPLLRTAALPRRIGTPWPGAVDPADRPADRPAQRPGAPAAGKVAARPRTRALPPGIPAEWHQTEDQVR